jgi:hypothetical protein
VKGAPAQVAVLPTPGPESPISRRTKEIEDARKHEQATSKRYHTLIARINSTDPLDPAYSDLQADLLATTGDLLIARDTFRRVLQGINTTE